MKNSPESLPFVIFEIKVIPNSPQNKIERMEEPCLRVRIHGTPEKGKANRELIRFLAKEFHVAQADITILSGHSARRKKIKINGIKNLDQLVKP